MLECFVTWWVGRQFVGWLEVSRKADAMWENGVREKSQIA